MSDVYICLCYLFCQFYSSRFFYIFFYCYLCRCSDFFFFFQAEDGIRDGRVTGVQTCAIPILTAVYAARALDTDAPCAIKLLRDDWDDPETGIKLLQREARAGLGVRHPHLVRVSHAHVTASPYFLVMDLLPGESLRRRLRRDFRLAVSEAVWIIRQISEALVALHAAGFLHGDIKPDNVRLIDDGTAVLIDLGFT